MDDSTREEISRLIAEGFNEGRLDDEEGGHVYWKLTTEEWNDEDE